MRGQKPAAADQALIDEDGVVMDPRWVTELQRLITGAGLSLSEPIPHELIIEFDQRIIVAGTRYFEDIGLFDSLMDDEAALYKTKGSFMFISGAAKTGADALVIEWCKKRGYPYAVFPADWDAHGKSAGYVRNAEMAKHLTNLTVFWDGKSNGTKHMIECAVEKGVRPHKYIVDIPPPEARVHSYGVMNAKSDPRPAHRGL
jgi:hypothetical protein